MVVLDDFSLPLVLVLGLVEDDAVVLVEDFLVTDEVLCVIVGKLSTLAATGVGLVVHCHVPSTSAQAWPSGALPYGLVWLSVVPSGANNLAWPPLLANDKLVLPLVSVRYPPAANVVLGNV